MTATIVISLLFYSELVAVVGRLQLLWSTVLVFILLLMWLGVWLAVELVW
ncbi:MAG: hypothetical protein ACI80F_001093, partial [Natronomonas sp.]